MSLELDHVQYNFKCSSLHLADRYSGMYSASYLDSIFNDFITFILDFFMRYVLSKYKMFKLKEVS